MQEKDRKRLQVNRLALVRGIVTDEDLLSFLMSKNILTDPMKDEISVVSISNLSLFIPIPHTFFCLLYL